MKHLIAVGLAVVSLAIPMSAHADSGTVNHTFNYISNVPPVNNAPSTGGGGRHGAGGFHAGGSFHGVHMKMGTTHHHGGRARRH